VGSGGLSEELDPEFLAFGSVFKGAIAKTRTSVQSVSDAQVGVLWSAHDALLACIGSILTRPDKAFPIENVSEKVRRAAIHVAVVQGIHVVEYCLSTGSYVQAGTLIRQEMEAVDGLRGIRQGIQKDGSTPRLKALRHLGRAYTEVTGLAHLSMHDLLAHVTDFHASGFDHIYNAEFSRYLMCLHLTALVGVTSDMAELHPCSEEAFFSVQEERWLASICGVLAEAGFMRVN
jgi:hypothetical protein